MQPAYQPFLVPLLDGADRARPATPPTSPLEEESLLKRPDWRLLAEQSRQAYGLPLLAQAPEGCAVLPVDTPVAAQPPRRCLRLQSAHGNWFVLEHPDALPLFDQYGRPGEQPALARPSLFTAWITGAAGIRTADDDHATPAAAESDTLAALHSWLAALVTSGRPSDWHLEPKLDRYASRLRVDGRLGPPEWLTRQKGDWLVNSILNRSGLDGRQPGSALEGRFSLPLEGGEPLPVRVSLVPSLHGPALVVRFLYPHHARDHELAGLGFSAGQREHLLRELDHREGLWLVAGPTGAGKSTTLHALLHLAVMRDEKVLAIEDPVERVVDGVQHLQVGQPPGLGFATAVRAFMRQAPDCLLVGEIRDRETADIALQAACTGHRVLSSIHARSSAGVRQRFRDLGQPEDQMERSCRVLVHQRLVACLCPACKRPAKPPAGWLAALERAGVTAPPVCHEAPGCAACAGGRSGRTGLFHLDRFGGGQSTRQGLLEAALRLVAAGRIRAASVHPFLPGDVRREFPLFQR